jgi:Chitin binding Peritrophin-A domain
MKIISSILIASVLALSLSIAISTISSESHDKFTLNDSICVNITFGLLPYPSDCTKFIICQNQQAELQICPNQSIFDESISACVLGDPRTCEIFTTTTIPTTTTTTQNPYECPAYDDP